MYNNHVLHVGKAGFGSAAWEDYQAILETLEILEDDKSLNQLRRSVIEVREGKTIPWQTAKSKLIKRQQ